jgi:hypothetical protein
LLLVEMVRRTVEKQRAQESQARALV